MGCDGFTASLSEAEHQVDPLVEVLRHVLTLQGRLVLLKKVIGICSGDGQDAVNMKQQEEVTVLSSRARRHRQEVT